MLAALPSFHPAEAGITHFSSTELFPAVRLLMAGASGGLLVWVSSDRESGPSPKGIGGGCRKPVLLTGY